MKAEISEISKTILELNTAVSEFILAILQNKIL